MCIRDRYPPVTVAWSAIDVPTVALAGCWLVLIAGVAGVIDTGSKDAPLVTEELLLLSLIHILDVYKRQSYYLASDGGDPSQFLVTENGAQLADLTDLPKSGYVEYTEDFYASSDQTTITFASRDDPGYLLLDDVSLVDPPPPAAPLPNAALATCVLLGLAGTFRIWRSRKQPARPASES